MEITFGHGVFADPYEKQANRFGYTFGDSAKNIQKAAYGLSYAHIHGAITDGEYEKIIRRFNDKVLLEKLKPLGENLR